MKAAGLTNTCISFGDTPSCSMVEDLHDVDEIRPGNFIFFDCTQLRIGSCNEEDIAVAVACPVVARHPERHEIVVYGGAIHLSKDFFEENGSRAYGCVALPQGNGWGPLLEGAYVASLSQEHGIIRMPIDVLAKVQVGDVLYVLPAHSCLTVDLFPYYLTLTGEKIQKLNRQ
jgi:D-serine deaminase-like pyridoxal phosphate-dependent protein